MCGDERPAPRHANGRHRTEERVFFLVLHTERRRRSVQRRLVGIHVVCDHIALKTRLRRKHLTERADELAPPANIQRAPGVFAGKPTQAIEALPKRGVALDVGAVARQAGEVRTQPQLTANGWRCKPPVVVDHRMKTRLVLCICVGDIDVLAARVEIAALMQTGQKNFRGDLAGAAGFNPIVGIVATIGEQIAIPAELPPRIELEAPRRGDGAAPFTIARLVEPGLR